MADQASADPQIGQSVSASPATPDPPVGSAVGTSTDGSTTWMGHLWNIARTVGSDVAAAGKDVYRTAQQSGGDPFKFVVDMGAQAGQAQLDQLKQSWDLAVNQHRYVEAYGHAVAGVTPLAGPVLAHAAEQVATGDPEQGDEAVGHVLSAGLMTAAPEAVSEALPGIKATIAARQAGRAPIRAGQFAADLPVAVPPSNATPYTPADVARATPYLAAEHASTPITAVPHLVDAADSAIAQIEDHIGQAIQSVPSGASIQTDPIASARAGLAQNVKANFYDQGLKELDNYPDLHDPDISFADADANRLQLNADNKAFMTANKYDVATALKTDPAFAARYYASSALRDGIYNGLADQGVDGVQNLRQDEGSLIAIRDAAQRQYFNGQRAVGGTGSTGPVAQAARRIIPAASAALGAELAGPGGAATADILGRTVTNAVLPGNLTRDALVSRAFQRLGQQPAPAYPAIPPPSVIRGFLPAPATALGEGEDPSGSGGLYPAQPMLFRDPDTGRFKRGYTSAIAGGGGS
jgi:hypothetical protein